MDQAPVTKAIFLDEVDILVTAGRGGDGCVSFRREKFVPKGGPDGGDGGNGGSVYIVADQSLNTLQHLAGHHHWKADKGGHGSGKTRHGRSGEDLFIRVPVGTIIYDSMHGIVLKDLVEEGQKTCIAHGGHGGRKHRVQNVRPPGAQAGRAGGTGPGTPAPSGAQAHRRRRPDRKTQRRQEHAHFAALGRPAEDRRLPVHHAGALPGHRGAAPATGDSCWPTFPA